MKLDKIDMNILRTLQDNARITNQHLADTIALSPSSCLQRVRRLEQEGIISAYHAQIELNRLFRHLVCIATVAMKNHTQDELRAFENLVNAIPEIVECLTVSGEFDFFLRVVCPDMARYLQINEQLVSSVNCAITINTHVVMSENKRFQSVDLATLDPATS
ncbi:Lrp/AsnC family transcriptional regulator [Halioxenophilus sp. WMMB6]|uniref:Lrp/AsnC family transcriptional regulator n=1 Tax=Halioxenophilus sp. WMMB6 TaxID=3073815 RepID=UPI00295E5DDC|nr:Lrp/AsnC family transcriptional regulator [Halioxenophilus sp. WMMB6]